MTESSKQIAISVPETMGVKQAQMCFMLGLETMMAAYRGGLSVVYATEDNLVKLVFNGQEAGAVIDFVNAIGKLKSSGEERIEDIQNAGSKSLSELAFHG